MITLDQIVSSNIEMLNEQEASLMKSLEFVRKAKELFESQSATGKQPAKRGRSTGRRKGSAAVKKSLPKKAGPVRRNRKGGSHLDRIIAVLKENKKPISSGELLQHLFSRQTADKDKKHFGTLIYPVLTKAYQSGALKSRGGKIHLPA